MYPADYELDVVLSDGDTAQLRPIKPEDESQLESFFTRLSAETIYQRFFRVKEELTPEELHYFTHIDYHDRMAFVVLDGGLVRGVGRYDRTTEDPTAAEVAFAVEDAHHGRGIGTHLLQALTAYARTVGIDHFRAYVLADNYPMMRVFRNTGFQLTRELEEGVYSLAFPTEATKPAIEAESERERQAIAASVLPIFYPRSVAVIGASRNPDSIGGRLFGNLLQETFSGPVYPVNPTAPVVGSVRAYPSVLDIPDPVDLAFIVVPRDFVIPVISECTEKGVRAVVVISAGFSETGDEGRELEAQLLEVVRESGMRMVGPNCMGVLNTDPAVQLNGTFGPIYPPKGNVAMSSQSGALGIAILDYARELGIGLSSFVSVGNKADVSANDLLLYWEGDPATDVIVLYVESFGNPRRFGRIARRISRTKPIVAVKSGRTAAGTRAASSHTGALASLDVAVDALFEQTGVIRVSTLNDLFDVTTLLANQPIPAGRRVGVITNAGGPGILTADALETNGLELPEFSTKLRSRLQGHLSPEASVRNPVDMIASAGPEQYRACLEELAASDEIDAVIAIYIPAAPEGSDAVAEAIRQAGLESPPDKTFLTVFMRASGAPAQLSTGERNRVPTFAFPEAAARALARAADYGAWRSKPEGEEVRFDDVDSKRARTVVEAFLDEEGDEGGWLEPSQVEAVLAAYGIALPVSVVAATAEEAVEAAAAIDGPVALKVISDTLLHKSDAGGVALDVDGENAVRSAFGAVTGVANDAEGALVQEFVTGGHEVIIGMTEDPSFGPLIVFGLGGIFVELIGDASFRIHPLTDVAAGEMISEVRSAKLLDGYRGQDPGDIDAVRETLLRVSALIEDLPEISEMDLNPVKVLAPGRGVRAVDARIRVRRVSRSFVPGRADMPATRRRG